MAYELSVWTHPGILKEVVGVFTDKESLESMIEDLKGINNWSFDELKEKIDIQKI